MLKRVDSFLGTDFAIFDETEVYRYVLSRIWDPKKAFINWCMLNPSTANADKNDRTIAKICRITKLWGFGRLYVTNINAYRSTNPTALYQVADPVGEHNDEVILEYAKKCAFTVCAWGAHGALNNRGNHVINLLRNYVELNCVVRTKDGTPGHPLYVTEATCKPIRLEFNAA